MSLATSKLFRDLWLYLFPNFQSKQGSISALSLELPHQRAQCDCILPPPSTGSYTQLASSFPLHSTNPLAVSVKWDLTPTPHLVATLTSCLPPRHPTAPWPGRHWVAPAPGQCPSCLCCGGHIARPHADLGQGPLSLPDMATPET